MLESVVRSPLKCWEPKNCQQIYSKNLPTVYNVMKEDVILIKDSARIFLKWNINERTPFSIFRFSVVGRKPQFLFFHHFSSNNTFVFKILAQVCIKLYSLSHHYSMKGKFAIKFVRLSQHFRE